jgi:hypothetical protein
VGTEVRRWRRRGAIAVALVPAFALAGCGTSEIDASKADQLVRNSVAQGNGTVRLKSVSCPSGVTVKKGGRFECKVSLTEVSTGAVHSGTVTVHMTNSNGQVTVAASDFHVQ